MASNIQTTTTTAMMPTYKKPGPPVPPRPHHTAAAGLLKNQRESVGIATANRASQTPTTATTTTSANIGGGLRQNITTPPEHPVIPRKPPLTAAEKETAGRTIIYKSPSLSLQQKQQEREKRFSGSDFTAMAAAPVARSATGPTQLNGKPPLKLRKAPEAPKPKQPQPVVVAKLDNNGNSLTESKFSASRFIANFTKRREIQPAKKLELTNKNSNNVVIVQTGNSVNLNRHNSLYTPKPPVGVKEIRHSLGKADTEGMVGRVQINQLHPATTPLPKPRTIVKMPVATLDLDNTIVIHHNTSIFRRSKTTLDSFSTRAGIATIRSSTTSSNSNATDDSGRNFGNSFLGGKTTELKNNLKNAAERLLSEIRSNQSTTAPVMITKHERIIQHAAVFEGDKQQPIIVRTSVTPQQSPQSNNCTRININEDIGIKSSPLAKSSTFDNILQTPDKKATFHELLISEIAAMRAKSSSMDNLHCQPSNGENEKKPTIPIARKRCDSLEDHDQEAEEEDDLDEDNVEDAACDEDSNLHKTLNDNVKAATPRKRVPSGGSSDSSPYGTERASRIRTSDWIEVGDNGKEVTLTSCQISLEDSGLEDEERIDDMSSSGVGDSWDSVKEAENEKRCRSVKRYMSITDLPPLPKSLSGINKMLGSDSGLLSDIEPFSNNSATTLPAATATTTTALTTTTTTTATTKATLECQKEENTNDSNNNNSNNSNNIEDNKNENDHKSTTPETNENHNEALTNTKTAIAAATPTATTGGTTLDAQLAILRKEMYGLRQLDLTLLSQLWVLNDSIQEFRTMLQEQEQMEEDEDEEDDDAEEETEGKIEQLNGTKQHTSSLPSVYDSNSLSSEGGEDDNSRAKSEGAKPKIITTQPKLTRTPVEGRNSTTEPIRTSILNSITINTQTKSLSSQLQQKSHASRLLDPKPMPRMRTAPPPPPTLRRMVPPPRST